MDADHLKWHAHVKEEPALPEQEITVASTSTENNGTSSRGWMCRFPVREHFNSRKEQNRHFHLQDASEPRKPEMEDKNMVNSNRNHERKTITSPSEMELQHTTPSEERRGKSSLPPRTAVGKLNRISCSLSKQDVPIPDHSIEESRNSNTSIQKQRPKGNSSKTSNCDSEVLPSMNQEPVVEKMCVASKKGEFLGFKCPDCGKVVRRSSGFVTHMKLHFLQESYQSNVPVKCKQCREIFINRKQLLSHKRTQGCSKQRRALKHQDHKIEAANAGRNTTSGDCEETLQKRAPRDSSSLKRKQLSEIYSDSFREICSPETRITDSIKSSVPEVSSEEQDSWCSEISASTKSPDKGRNNSATLSLRLFRIHKPHILSNQIEPCDIERNGVPKTSVLISTADCNLENEVQSMFPMQEAGVISEQVPNQSMVGIETQEQNPTKRCKNDTVNNKNVRHGAVGHFKYYDSYRTPLKTKTTKEQKIVKSIRTGKVTSANMVEKEEDLPKNVSELASPAIDGENCRRRIEVREVTKDVPVPHFKIKIKPIVMLNRLRAKEMNSAKISKKKSSARKSTKRSTLIPKRTAQKGENNVHNIPSDRHERIPAVQTANSISNCSLLETEKEKVESMIQDQNARKTDVQEMTDIETRDRNYEIVQQEAFKTDNNDKLSFPSLQKKYSLRKCYVKLLPIHAQENICSSKVDDQDNNCNTVRDEVKPFELQIVDHQLKTSPNENDYGIGHDHLTCDSSIDLHGLPPNLTHAKCTPLMELKKEPFQTECSWCDQICCNQECLTNDMQSNMIGYKCHICTAKFHFHIELQSHLAACSLVSLLNCHVPSPPDIKKQ